MARLFRTALPLLIALAGPATAQTAATTAGVAGTNLTTGGAVSLPAITATPSTSARSNDIHCADERRHIVIDGRTRNNDLDDERRRIVIGGFAAAASSTVPSWLLCRAPGAWGTEPFIAGTNLSWAP
jgi:hypothetical protein